MTLEPKSLGELLTAFAARKEVIAAAIIDTDGLIVDFSSKKDVDIDRIGALLGTYFSNTEKQGQGIRLLQLPKQEEASCVLLASVSQALFALLMNSSLPKEQMLDSFKNDIARVELVLNAQRVLSAT